MSITIPTLSVVFTAAAILAGIIIPVCLFLFLKKKCGCDAVPFFVGCGVMFLFAFVLEGAAHSVVLGSAAGAAIKGSVWLYAVYAGLMAGLFEESGRLLAFRLMMRKYGGKDCNALMYGAGHGGFEAFYLLSIGLLNHFICALLLNSGKIGSIMQGFDEQAAAALKAALEQLAAADPFTFLLGIAERIPALVLHMSLSVFVWFAAKRGGKFYLLAASAAVIHAVVDAAAVVLNAFVSRVILTETVILILALLTACAAAYVWKKMRATESEA